MQVKYLYIDFLYIIADMFFVGYNSQSTHSTIFAKQP